MKYRITDFVKYDKQDQQGKTALNNAQWIVNLTK
jgi:hypothetical protein